MLQILDQQLGELAHRDGLRRFTLQVNARAKQWLIQQSMSPGNGARPVARTLQRELLDPLSLYLLEDSIHEGDVIHIQVKEDGRGLAMSWNL